MTRQNYRVEVYRLDRRYKDGERISQVINLENETQEWVNWYVDMLKKCCTEDKYRVNVKQATVTVKSLMTNKEVEIDVDTPWCCNPASESFWSM